MSFQKTLLFHLSIALLLLSSLLGGLWYFGKMISQYSVEIAQSRQDLANKTAAVASLASLQTEYATRAEEDLELLYNKIPTYDQLIDLPKEIEMLGARENLNVAFTYGTESRGPNTLGTMPYSVVIYTSDFAKAINFVNTLKNFRYLNTVDSMSFYRKDGSLETGIRGRVFYQ